MAKITTHSGQSDSLVMLSFGWYGKFVLPVSAASQIATLLVESGAVKVESESVEGIAQSFYRPTKSDFSMQSLDCPFMADVPINDEKRKEYVAYLKTKAGVIGKSYEPETYSQFLKVKDAS